MKTVRTRKSMILTGVFVLVAAIGTAALVLTRSNGAADLARTIPLTEVREGPLTISITEAGTITARDQVVIQNEVEGRTTIISLVPEGQFVEEGDLLIELDASQLEQSLVERQIREQNAEAAFIRARENLEVTKNQAESDLKKAQLDYELAQMDLQKYLEGEYPNQVREAESRITLAKEEVERVTEKYAWSERLFNEKYISQTELESDRLAKNRAELDYELSMASLDLLKEFTYKRRLAELESNVTQTSMALERTTRKARADVVQAEADLKAKEAEYKQEQDRLAKLEQQIAKTKIYAPVSGMVIYATSARGGWRGNDEPLDAGREVREREELIYLPTADVMMAEVKVHESNLQKMRVGLPARITVDALPGAVFQGRVRRIAPLPDAQSVWLNPDLKVFNTQIEILGSPQGLRTGMTCQTEIIVDRYDSALYIPLQCVVRVNNQPTVYTVAGNSLVPRPVEVGLDNNRMIRIVSGLTAGEQVVLAPPLPSDSRKYERENEADSSLDDSAPREVATDGSTAPQGMNGGAGAPPQARSPQDAGQNREAGRQRFQNMSESEREAMRQRFQNMTPEDRERMRQQFQPQQPANQ